MKKLFAGFLIGAITTISLTAIAVEMETINVSRNTINLEVNKIPVAEDNFIFEGRTYVQLRSIGEILRKDVGWDAESRTASINDKTTNDVGDVKTDDIIISALDKHGELITLTNNSKNDITLTNWKIVSVRGNQTYTFPKYILKAETSVSIASGDKTGDLAWGEGNIWNNSKEDIAELYNQNGILINKK